MHSKAKLQNWNAAVDGQDISDGHEAKEKLYQVSDVTAECGEFENQNVSVIK